jgi:hypothetical protein
MMKLFNFYIIFKWYFIINLFQLILKMIKEKVILKNEIYTVIFIN